MNWDRGAGVLPTTHRRMTADEYFQLPDGPPYFQLIDGELFMSPAPNYFHQRIVVRIVTALEIFLRSHPLGKVNVAPSDVRLEGDNVFQPDVYFIRQERLGIVRKQGPSGAPDLVVEVLSDSTARLDAGPKKTVYADDGVVEYWVVDPEKQEVRIYLLQQSRDEPAQVLHEGESITTALLPGFALPVAEVFAG